MTPTQIAEPSCPVAAAPMKPRRTLAVLGDRGAEIGDRFDAMHGQRIRICPQDSMICADRYDTVADPGDDLS